MSLTSFKNNFTYFWLCWVFVALCRLSLVAASMGYSSLQCAGFSLRWPLLLGSMGSRHTGFSSCHTMGSVAVVHGLSCSKACGIFLGIRSVSPELAGEFLFTEPPGKSQIWLFNRDQDHPHGKEMQKSKMAVWGGLTNSCEKKRSEKQRRKGKI